MSRNRGIDPSPVNLCRGPRGCGRDVLPTPFGIAEHRAYHFEARPFDATPTVLHEAWRAYAKQLEALCSDLRGRIGKLEDERRRLLEDVATRDEIVEQLEADYQHLVGELHELRTQLAEATR